MSRRCGRWILGLAGMAAGLGASLDPRLLAQAGQQPVFKSGVELIAVDVAIVDKAGNPVAGLRPDQFDVTIDGKPRRVVSAEFIEYASRDKPGAARPVPAPETRPLFSSNEQPVLPASRGRLIFLAVDQGSFRPAGAHGAMEAARRFIDRLQPEDRIGLVAFPAPGPSVPASRDHAAARAATAQIIGSALPFRMGGLDKNVGLAEAIDIHAGDEFTFGRVVARECAGLSGAALQLCAEEVRSTAASVGRTAEMQADLSLAGLQDVITGLSQIRERKTLVLVSAGLPVADRIGNLLQSNSIVVSLGRKATAANLNFYVLHIDSGFLDAFSASERTMSDSLGRDLGIMSTGLETISGAAGGSLARVVAGADFAFDRLLRETSAAYLLGVEPVEGDRDGKPHRIDVKAKIPNAEVRSRKEFVMPKADARPATPEDALIAAFRADRQERGLPIRVTTHSLASGAKGGYRVLVSADIGEGFAGPAELRLLYAFTDASGQTLPPAAQKLTLRPRAGGPAGAVAYTSQDALPPGAYTLRFVALDAEGRLGSVNHAFSVGLTKGDGVRMSDLLLVEPRRSQNEDIVVITDGQLRGTAVDAYIEVAPATQSAKVTGVTFGVADRPDGAPLVSTAARPFRAEGAGHWSAGATLSLTLLPPGDYFATAIVLADKRTVGRMTRPIHIERAAVPAAGVETAAGSSPRVSFAAGEAGSLVRAFSLQDVLSRGTIEYFVERLRSANPDDAAAAPIASAAASVAHGNFDEALASLTSANEKSLSATFLGGLALLGKGEYEPAAVQFRTSLDSAPDFLPAAFYLGACYAANGRDREAAGAWQIALISESDTRIIYDVLADALLRLREGEQAVSLLSEARDKWTGDEGFLPRLAAAEALGGRPAEALALLDGYISRHSSDADPILLAIRLLYDARSAGKRITSAREDAAAAGRFAALYKAAGGPDAALVDRWAAFIISK